jgi:putative flippase GtrA
LPRLTTEFIKFAVVGTVGFLVDAAILHLMVTVGGAGLYGSRIVSYLGAATTTWFLNRHFTFHGAANTGAERQWRRFVLVNGLGGSFNYAVYAALVATGGVFASHPVGAVAVGSLAGLIVNFFASRRIVFRP